MKSISRKQAGMLITLFVIAAVSAYFLFQLRPVIEPPFLLVSSPDRDTIMHASTTMLEGRVSAHTDLTINGRRVYGGEDGVFKTEWDLVSGLNRFDFHATNNFGKSSEVFRYILVK
ncbi:hypothetical protein KGQ34_01485 [Patescibacteria group bacterium]|nr:hypothetical protein [Patescibacteria group bacterium]